MEESRLYPDPKHDRDFVLMMADSWFREMTNGEEDFTPHGAAVAEIAIRCINDNVLPVQALLMAGMDPTVDKTYYAMLVAIEEIVAYYTGM